MMKRAQCKGEEAAAVAVTLQKLEHLFAKMTAPKTEVPVKDPAAEETSEETKSAEDEDWENAPTPKQRKKRGK
jgi:hypothetical protein